MERAKIKTVIINDEVQSSRKYMFEKIKDDKRVIDFLKKHELDQSFLQNNIQTFYDWIKVRNVSDNCSLDKACLLNNGYFEDLHYDGILTKRFTPCIHQITKDKREGFISNYTIKHFPDSLIDVSIKDILSNNEPLEYLEKVAEIATFLEDESHGGYYIYGDVGVGKTYLTSALTNVLATQSKKIAFVHVPTLSNDLKSMISRRESIDKILYNLKNVDVLVLDDIGSEGVSDWLRDDILLSILNYRMEYKLACFYTSNLSMDELYDYYSVNNRREINKLAAERLLERVRMTSKEVKLTGKNRREYL